MSESIEVNDELLSAYLDDELEPGLRARVEEALARDPGVNARLELLRAAERSVAHAFALEPVAGGDPLAARILSDQMPALTGRRRPLRWIGAVAAGIGGLLIGYGWSTIGGHAGLPALTNTALLAALDTQPSGSEATLAGVTTHLLLTFRAADGHYCRVFEVRGKAQGAEGIACREQGRWHLRGWDATAVTHGFRAAGSSRVIDGIMDNLGGDPALDAEQERALLERQWR